MDTTYTQEIKPRFTLLNFITKKFIKKITKVI